MSNIGKRVAKLDAPDKAQGRSRYVHDITLPGMLYGKILRSEVASARVIDIDTSRAMLPGVKAVITYKDVPKTIFGFGSDRSAFCDGTVRCVGDELAAVAALDEETARESLKLMRVEYEELPALFDCRKSIGSAVRVHSDKESNLFREYKYSHGDVDKAFARCEAVAEGSYSLPYQAHCCMGTSGVVADWSASGKLTMYTPTQAPFLIQRDIAKALGITPSDVRIIQPTIGGGFGQRLDLYPHEVICALLAKETGRPVKILFDRYEEFLMDPLRPRTYISMKTGADKNGRIIACDCSVIVDAGAYISWGAVTPIVMMHTIGCMYDIESVRFNSKVVYTNNPHTGAMRGFGNPELIYALETQVDTIAQKLGVDPVRLRLLNANKPGQVTRQGSKITSCAFDECIRRAAERINWKSARERQKTDRGHVRRGVGIASVFHVGGGARIYRSDGCGTIVQVDDFGRVTVTTASTDIGQGSETVIAQIVAQELGVPLSSVEVHNSDTQVRVWDVGVHASRTTFIGGNSARLAASDAKKQLLAEAARLLGGAPENLHIKDGVISRKDRPESQVTYDKVVRAAHFRRGGTAIIGRAYYDPPSEMVDKENRGNISGAYSFGAQAVEVEVDTQTGAVKVLKVVSAHDVGRAINPMYLEGQIEGGILMGMGYALVEEPIVREGKILNADFHDYRVFGPKDMPEMECVIIESNDPEGPFGAKGIGELPMIPTAPAIANAIYNAVGVRMYELPMTPECVYMALSRSGKDTNGG